MATENMMDINEIKKLIPQRYPLLMLDKVIDVTAGKSIKAYKNISINETYFNGHFPDKPIFPGALTAEAMAQAACVLLKKSIKDLTATSFYVTNMKKCHQLNLLHLYCKSLQAHSLNCT